MASLYGDYNKIQGVRNFRNFTVQWAIKVDKSGRLFIKSRISLPGLYILCMTVLYDRISFTTYLKTCQFDTMECYMRPIIILSLKRHNIYNSHVTFADSTKTVDLFCSGIYFNYGRREKQTRSLIQLFAAYSFFKSLSSFRLR